MVCARAEVLEEVTVVCVVRLESGGGPGLRARQPGSPGAAALSGRHSEASQCGGWCWRGKLPWNLEERVRDLFCLFHCLINV